MKQNKIPISELKTILEQQLLEKELWMNSQRGRDYEEYSRRSLIYHNDKNHLKLKKINDQINAQIEYSLKTI